MKKILSILLVLAMMLSMLVACGDNNTNDSSKDSENVTESSTADSTDKTDDSATKENKYDDLSKAPAGEKSNIRVSVLNGTTGFGMAHLMEKNSNNQAYNNYSFSIETDGSTILGGLINGSVDIATLPTNAASTVHNKTKANGGVKLLAINTLGVLYVVQTGDTVKSINDLNGKTIYCPAQNPQFIVNHILDKNNIENYTIDTTYAQPADLRAALAAGKLGENAIAVLPEPMVTIAQAANSSIKAALDLTKEWNKVEKTPLVQGCVVVRAKFYEENKVAVERFLYEYNESIKYLKSDVENAAKLIVKHGIFNNENVAKNAIPKCNVVFMYGKEMKGAMNGFLSAMLNVAPASIGGALPDDSFYYINE